MTQDMEDRTVCFCHNVSLSELLTAIRGGARTLAAVQEKTRASTGCGGCEWEVLAVLEEEAAKATEESQ